MLRSRTLQISIACSPQRVYDYVADPTHLPHWAPGLCLAIRPDGDHWLLTTPQGELTFRFAAPNALGVLDHFVGTPSGEIHVPMRVIANGTGSELLFTLFQQPGMSEADFTADAALVEQDLLWLKSLLESAPNPSNQYVM
ncbi:SRPBCC family protein [Ferriphaselus sp. R-1]|uniref:SRPBCC family protein n=1 Tax=Ferriphaselus sp. R-1 TaxID=1485544 RepID=UPI00192A0121|nr:SRPBCC family protein [Ferriphaselus sp. R-1]